MECLVAISPRMCGGGVLSRCLVRDFFAGRQCLSPLNRECISRMCRTYLEWLTLHKTAVLSKKKKAQREEANSTSASMRGACESMETGLSIETSSD